MWVVFKIHATFSNQSCVFLHLCTDLSPLAALPERKNNNSFMRSPSKYKYHIHGLFIQQKITIIQAQIISNVIRALHLPTAVCQFWPRWLFMCRIFYWCLHKRENPLLVGQQGELINKNKSNPQNLNTSVSKLLNSTTSSFCATHEFLNDALYRLERTKLVS